MNKQVTLLTAASVAAFFGATQTFAGGPDLAPSVAPGSHSHVNISAEGLYGRSNDFTSIFNLSNATNDATPVYTASDPVDLDAVSKLGWAASLGYTFDDQSDLTLSYRNMKQKNKDVTRTYSSISQIQSNSTGGYTPTGTPVSAVSNYVESDSIQIGDGNTGKAFAVTSATDTLTESSETKYQQANIDWGHRFTIGHGMHIRPYVGVGWRSVGYKDTMAFASVGAITGATPTSGGNDYFETTSTHDANATIGFKGGGTALDITTGVLIKVGTLSTEETPSTTDAVTLVSTNPPTLINEYGVIDSSAYDTTLGTRMPSYTSKFSGLGPRVGMDAMFSIGPYVAVTGGFSMTMPYAKLKTTGSTTAFTTRDMQSGGVTATTTTGSTLQTGVNLQADAADYKTFSNIERKFIPELEMSLGIRVANNIAQQGKVTYFLEGGYRVIQDWNAIENVSTAVTSTTQGAATNQFGGTSDFSYADVTNFGPYLKAGITFGT